MADDAFYAMCVTFERFLPPGDDRDYWIYAVRQYENGRFSANMLSEIMKGFQSQPPSAPASTTTEWETIEEPVWPTLAGTKGGGKPQAASGRQSGKGGPNFGTAEKGDGKKGGFGKGDGKGKGKFSKGGKGEFSKGGKGDGKFQKGGKGDGKNRQNVQGREIIAVNLADAQNRMDLWLAQHPKFIFRPRAEVPEQFREVYQELGEDGPHLWKNLRPHLTDEKGLVIAGRFLQFLAENSTWKVAKNCVLEKERKLKKEKDALASKMSVATGYTGMSTRTMRR